MVINSYGTVVVYTWLYVLFIGGCSYMAIAGLVQGCIHGTGDYA